MKLVRFLADAIHGDALMRRGDEKMVEDSYSGPHILNVATGETGAAAAPAAQSAFRADLASAPAAQIAAPTTEAEARAFGNRIGGVVGAVINHLWAEIDRLRGRQGGSEAPWTAAAARPAQLAAVATPTDWRAHAITLVKTEADTILSPEQAKALGIIVKGALVGDAGVVVPNTGRWAVENATTGAHALRVHTADGAGVAITQGTGTWVYADGKDVLLDPNAPAPRSWPVAPPAPAQTPVT